MTNMTTALTVQDKINPLVRLNLRDVADVAALIFASRTYDGIESKEQAAIKIIAGAEYGFSPFQSMSMVDFIKGRPTLNAHAKATLIKSSGDYNFRILELSNQVCKIEIFRKNGQGEFKSLNITSFTIADAEAAQLTTGANAHSWRKFPRNMLFARAISNIWRWDCPDLNTRFGQGRQVPDLQEFEPPVELITEFQGEANDQPAAHVDDEIAETYVDGKIDCDDDPEVLRVSAVALLASVTGGEAHEIKKILKGKQIEMMNADELRVLLGDLSVM